ncbi:hypothetical protein FBU30_006677 [Linnemannia zychae]|nr:hypothetical protein FBU30_006677 [Linnemannia zychae]
MTTSSLTSPHDDSPATTVTDILVLISGAGPTGLMAAILLAKMGIRSKVIERDMTVSPLSKAISLHPRTLEIFQFANPELVERFKEETWMSHKGRVYFGGKLTAEVPWTPATESQFHYTHCAPQTTTVRLLTEEYERTGMGSIERGWELTDTRVIEIENTKGGEASRRSSSWVETTVRRAIEGTNKRQGENPVLGTVEQAEEDKEKKYEYRVIRSSFLIGADGGRSTVRHILKIPFLGRTRDINIILFDGHIDTDLPLDEIASINGNNMHAVGMFPLYGNRVRFLLSDGTLIEEELAARNPKTPTKEYFEKLLEATVAPHKVKVLSYNWLTYYRPNERRASHFVHKQRIFLAGDAAHCHSPMGGQGLNTGLQDSYNLAWKIGMVLNGTAPLALVDSYNEERVPIADEIIQYSAKSLSLFVSENYLVFQIRKMGLTLYSYIQPYLFTGTGTSNISMLGLRYHKNSLNKEHCSQNYASTAPASIGKRAPDGLVYSLNPEHAPIRLYHLMSTPGAFQILVFTSNRLTQEIDLSERLTGDIEHYQQSWIGQWPGIKANASLSNKTTPHFMVHVISSRSQNSTFNFSQREVGYGKLYFDSEKGDLHKRYGISAKGGIIVVRPDSHISYRVVSIDKLAWIDVNGYFESILERS